MIVAADANVLIAELNRDRGYELILDPRRRVTVTQEQWGEAHYEIDRRLRLRVA